MAKRNKSQQRSTKYSAKEREVRPVTESNTWCLFKKPRDGIVLNPKAPYGYVVTIPYIPNQLKKIGNVNGYIVRTKKHCGSFLMQVISRETAREYGIQSYSIPMPSRRNKKKHSRIMHMLNLEKGLKG